MGEALSISFSRVRQVRSSGDPLIELLTFLFSLGKSGTRATVYRFCKAILPRVECSYTAALPSSGWDNEAASDVAAATPSR